MSRGQAGVVLSVSVSTIRRMERDGRLCPVVGEDGVHRFRVREVQDLARALGVDPARAEGTPVDPRRAPPHGDAADTNGDLAAKAFQAFGEGMHPVAAVVALKIAPALIADLHRRWVELRGGLVLPAEARREIERLIGAPITAENVGKVLTILVGAAVRAKVDRPRFPHIGPPGS